MMKGTNVPKLMTIITYELGQMIKIRKGEMDDERLMYEFHELTPEEQDQQTIRNALEEVKYLQLFHQSLFYNIS